ncbi:hypothetical protein GGR56DRAFT_452224 [Xylariaceae sp. FL0804]|nr:hypothetical protein GGR56DRAFT_452224 [Xylariaceae sp. FL0804]
MADHFLPKVIEHNKEKIHGSYALHDAVPLEMIFQGWKTSSTMYRKMLDPNDRRLKNFWWRVYGGNRRYLSGAVIARLVTAILVEPAFVNLRGPPNQYEAPSPEPRADQHRHPQTPHREPDRLEKPRPKAEAKTLPPSSSNAPHPILKKPREPSASGPKPTARFVSPQGSDSEEGITVENDGPSSGSTAVTQSLESKGTSIPTTREERKKLPGSTPKKKTPPTFVASKPSRRRPAMPRRGSSQAASTGASDITSRDVPVSPGLRGGRTPKSPSTINERAGKRSSSNTSMEEAGERLSAKAAGKLPARQGSASASTLSDPDSGNTGHFQRQQTPGHAETPERRDSKSTRATDENLSKSWGNRSETGQIETKRRQNSVQELSRYGMTPPMNRSRSDIGSPRRTSQETGRGRVTPQSLVSPSTTIVSNATAQGTIIEFDENAPAKAVADVIREQENNPVPAQAFSPRPTTAETPFTPTQPSTTTSVPLGRSKSQLSLLLERQGDKKSRR